MIQAAKSLSLSNLRERAWDMLSAYIRLSHADHRGFCACYTCGAQQHWKEMHAGHAIDGRRNAVLLDDEIVKPQCPRCNVALDGNHPVFTAKLIRQHGAAWWNSKLAASRKPKKYYRADLEQFIEAHRTRIRIIEKSRKWEFLNRHAGELRNPQPMKRTVRRTRV